MDSLTHRTQKPAQPSPGKPPLLLLLHGVGSHEGDLMGLAPYVDGRFFAVSARGPLTVGPGAYAWFHVAFEAGSPVIVPEEAEESRHALIRFIDEVITRYDLDPERVYLMGFSQGAIMGLSLALTVPDRLAGVVAMSGRILPQILPQAVSPERMKGLPIFVVHGEFDPLLPVDEYGRRTRDILARLPVALTYREYAMAHQVSDESLRDVVRWLAERLERPRRDEPTGSEVRR
ncbi:MAG TPA: alpha/beta fold hydrolase [bacterium]|jgi:phospholipase/carboxylesterase